MFFLYTRSSQQRTYHLTSFCTLCGHSINETRAYRTRRIRRTSGIAEIRGPSKSWRTANAGPNELEFDVRCFLVQLDIFINVSADSEKKVLFSTALIGSNR